MAKTVALQARSLTRARLSLRKNTSFTSIHDLERVAGPAKYELRIVVLPPDLLPRQPFLLYPPSAVTEFEAIFRLSRRHPEIISLALLFYPAGIWRCSWTSRASGDGFGASPAAGLDGGDCYTRRAGTI